MKTNKTKTVMGPGLSPLIAAIVTTLLISITSAQGQAPAKEKAWVLQERTLPVTAAASEALRDSIAEAPQPDVASSQGTTFKTNEEWVKYIAAADEAAVATVEALAKRLKVTNKEETIAGVTVFRVTPANINLANKNRLFVHTHGGAYVVNNGRAGLFEAILVAHRAAIPLDKVAEPHLSVVYNRSGPNKSYE